MVTRFAALLTLLALAGCGLLSPPDPPASEIEVTDGPPVPDAPIPFAPAPDAPTPDAPTTPPTSTPTAPPPIPADTSSPTPPSAPPATPPFPGYRLVFNDEFNGTGLDTTSWNIVDGTNRGGVASPESVTVRDGALRLTSFTDAAGVHRTGIITSKGLHTYGYFEARLRPSEKGGHWCAFWLSSPTIGNPIGDPGTAGVEIDVIEHRFENRDRFDLSNMTFMNLNWDGFGQYWQREGRLTALPGNAPVQNAWHTYAVLWNETGNYFYVDGVPLWKTSAAISHRSEFLVFSCEVQNNSWAGWIPAGGYGTRETSTTGMQVDFVRVWQQE